MSYIHLLYTSLPGRIIIGQSYQLWLISVIAEALPPVVGIMLSQYLQIHSCKAATALRFRVPMRRLDMRLRRMLDTMRTAISLAWFRIPQVGLQVGFHLMIQDTEGYVYLSVRFAFVMI